MELAVYPRPREVLHLEASTRSHATTIHAAGPDLPPQGYELRISPEQVRLAARDDAGRRYGENTIAQLRAADGTLPCAHIRDWPDLAIRGYLLDVSRSRVPTRPTLLRLVDLLELGRYNHLQLYIEHAFAYEGHAEVWRDVSPLSADDLEWLDERCRAAGIELAGNQNCFGHMERWLEVDAHRHRAECPDGWEPLPGLRRAPTTLAPTPDNAAFVLGLVREQMAHLHSRTINVGCDETFELGRGRSAEAVAEHGLGAVYVEHLDRIIRPLTDEGCTVQYWGDVVRSYPDQLGSSPALGQATALAWTYEAPRAAGTDQPLPRSELLEALGIDLDGHRGFEQNAAPFVEAGVPFWVVPGTSTWNSLVGRIDNARANLQDAARQGRELGASGFLVADWGDNGHLQPPSISFAPILYGAAVAWCEQANAGIDVTEVLDARVFDDAAQMLGSVLDRIGRTWATTGMHAFNSSPLQAGLCPDQHHLVGGRGDPDAIHAVIATLDAASGDLDRARPGCADGSIVVEELRAAIGLARHGAHRLAAVASAPLLARGALRHDLAGWIEHHRAAWLLRARPGGLDRSTASLEATLARYG